MADAYMKVKDNNGTLSLIREEAEWSFTDLMNAIDGDLVNLEKPRVIASDGKGSANTVSQHICIPVSGGSIVSMTGGSNATYYAFLTSDTVEIGVASSFSSEAGYTSRILLSANEATGEIIVPSDAKYLYFASKNNVGTNQMPASIVIDGVERTDNIRQNISDITTKADRIYNTVSAMVSDMSLKNGMNVQTIGFASVGDNGGAYYQIGSGLTANNCDIIALSNGLFASLVCVDGTVSLESLNIGTVSYSVINQRIAARGIKNVTCGDITVSESVVINDYDFEFNSITYTGNDFAVIIDDVNYHYIKGNAITASNGSGIKLTSTSNGTRRNHIDVRGITVKNIGIGIYPINSHGISRNRYVIGNIDAENNGILSYIPANTNKYSWEGEDFFSVQNAKAHNANGTGVGVTFKIDPVDGKTVDGTITGITFSNLGIEGSDRGVLISCGGSVNPDNGDACIKSIVINNMRTRENSGMTYLLNASGYIKELYVKPTSSIRLSQWSLYITPPKIRSYIDADIYNSSEYSPIGHGLSGMNGIRYIEKPTCQPMTVTGNISENDMASDESSLFMSRYYIVDSSLLGTTVNLSLHMHYQESAQNIMIRVPAKSGNNAATVSVSFRNRTSYHTDFTNNDSSDHIYMLSCYWDRTSPTVERHVLTDLGSIT